MTSNRVREPVRAVEEHGLEHVSIDDTALDRFAARRRLETHRSPTGTTE